MAASAALLTLPAAPTAAALRFDAELICLEVRQDTLRVDGTYHFLVSPPSRPSRLFYPYPADSLLGAAWTESLAWRAHSGAPWTPLSPAEHPERSGALWSLPAVDGDRFEVRTVYCQLLRERYARYIVSTTRAWSEPLREARFELRLPAGAQLVECSYPFVREGELWVFAARDFWPAVDISFRWAPLGGPD